MSVIKIENISEGQIVKNYKAMCAELDVPIEAGNSKKAQLKEWECHFAYERQGNKFIITEIYDIPKEKVDGRGKSSKYGELIQFLLADALFRTKRKHLSIGITKLLTTINMVNENYGFCSTRIKEISEHYKINPYVIYDFYNTSNSNLKGVIETALNNMRDKRVLRWEKIIKICTSETGSTHRKATTEEWDLIDYYEAKALEEFPCDGMEEIRKSRYWKAFRETVKDYLNVNTHIKYYYHAYFISVQEEYIEKERDRLLEHILDKPKRETLRKKLNGTVMENFIENAEKRHLKSFTSNSKMRKYRIKDTYPKHIEQLVDLLINESQGSIKSQLKSNKANAAKELQKDIDNHMNAMNW